MSRNKTRGTISRKLKEVSRFPKDRFIRDLLLWYSRNQRDLPWRRTNDPYAIWVSEIMLQQTQVQTVISYYTRFLKLFPTVSSLARSPLQTVLKSWEGLGYYTRARNLQRAAQMIMERWKGKIPSDPALLESIPGIGRSTAGAIASIAFERPAPLLDGNVRRVLCRILEIRKDPTTPQVQNQLWKFSQNLLPSRRVGMFSQAMMELGAVICLPKNPNCDHCPVKIQCTANRSGTQTLIPTKKPARSIPREEVAVAIIQRGPFILMAPRPNKGLLAGLWSFPEIPNTGSATKQSTVLDAFSKISQMKLKLIKPLNPVVHTYSHKKVTYLPFLFHTQNRRCSKNMRFRWVELANVPTYPLSTATLRILAQIPKIQISHLPLPLVAEEQNPYMA